MCYLKTTVKMTQLLLTEGWSTTGMSSWTPEETGSFVVVIAAVPNKDIWTEKLINAGTQKAEATYHRSSG